MTKWNEKQLGFHALGKRAVIGKFDGGAISSDGGALLLSEVEAKTHIVAPLAGLFVDHRKPDLIEHSVRGLIGQRVFGLVLGYEDLNDHDRLRFDPFSRSGRQTGSDRASSAIGAGPGQGTGQLQHTQSLGIDGQGDRKGRALKKIVANPKGMDRLLVDCFLQSDEQPPPQIWIDLDATDDPTHGRQKGRFVHGYYGHYCYLPLYIFSREHLLYARPRPSNIEVPPKFRLPRVT